MNENLKQVLSQVGEMPEIQEKLKSAGSLDEVYEIMQSVQSGYTLDEFKAAMAELKDAKTEELSDEDLDSVAGGATHGYSITNVGETLVTYLTLGIG